MILPLFAAAALLWMPTNSISQPAEPQHKMWAELNLTPEQKDKLKALHKEMKSNKDTHFVKVKAVREKIKDELQKASPSQSMLSGYAIELGNLHKDMNLFRIDHLLKVKQMLTTEQFQKLTDKEWKGENCKGGMGGPGNCKRDGSGKGGHGKGHGKQCGSNDSN
jgi:Spy/CpxP family protein refolding chaperone